MLEAEIFKKLPHFNLHVCLSIGNETIAILGASGARKTTFLNCLAGLVQSERGEIVLNGKVLFSSLRSINLPPRRRQIGYVFQSYALFPHLTVRQNAAYGTRRNMTGVRTGLDVEEVLELLHIAHLADRYPGQISGGEKQRTALARALLARPEMLLLDEPLAALDYDTRCNLRYELKSLQRSWGIPFILVTHDREEAEFLGIGLLSWSGAGWPENYREALLQINCV